MHPQQVGMGSNHQYEIQSLRFYQLDYRPLCHWQDSNLQILGSKPSECTYSSTVASGDVGNRTRVIGIYYSRHRNLVPSLHEVANRNLSSPSDGASYVLQDWTLCRFVIFKSQWRCLSCPHWWSHLSPSSILYTLFHKCQGFYTTLMIL